MSQVSYKNGVAGRFNKRGVWVPEPQTAQTTASKPLDREYAMLCQKSADAWALAYSRNECTIWQAKWAADRARQAWEGK